MDLNQIENRSEFKLSSTRHQLASTEGMTREGSERQEKDFIRADRTAKKFGEQWLGWTLACWSPVQAELAGSDGTLRVSMVQKIECQQGQQDVSLTAAGAPVQRGVI